MYSHIRQCAESSVNLIDSLVFFFTIKKDLSFFTDAYVTIKPMHFMSSELVFTTKLVAKNAKMHRFYV